MKMVAAILLVWEADPIISHYFGVKLRFVCLYGVCLLKGYTVEHLVEALRYKPEGRGFDSLLCHWDCSLT